MPRLGIERYLLFCFVTLYNLKRQRHVGLVFLLSLVNRKLKTEN